MASMQTEEQPKDTDLKSVMLKLVDAVQDSNIDLGRLLGSTGSLINRLGVLLVIAIAVALGLGVQLFLGFTSQEMARSAKVQLALEAQARADLEKQFQEAIRGVEELKKSVGSLRTVIQEVPRVTVDDRGRVNLEIHADEDTQKTFRTRNGEPKSDTVKIPLSPQQSRY